MGTNFSIIPSHVMRNLLGFLYEFLAKGIIRKLPHNHLGLGEYHIFMRGAKRSSTKHVYVMCRNKMNNFPCTGEHNPSITENL